MDRILKVISVFFNGCGSGPAWLPLTVNMHKHTLKSQIIKITSSKKINKKAFVVKVRHLFLGNELSCHTNNEAPLVSQSPTCEKGMVQCP